MKVMYLDYNPKIYYIDLLFKIYEFFNEPKICFNVQNNFSIVRKFRKVY